MKSFVVPVLVALSLAATMAPVVSAKPAPPPRPDLAFGFGVRAPSCPSGCPAGSFAFNARSDANGDNASGWFYADFPGYAGFTGAVTCLDVNGKWATLFGTISTGTGAADPATYSPGADPLYFVAVVHDVGKGSRSKPSPDEMSLVGWDTEAGYLADPGIALAEVCGSPTVEVGPNMFGLVGGELSVVDH